MAQASVAAVEHPSARVAIRATEQSALRVGSLFRAGEDHADRGCAVVHDCGTDDRIAVRASVGQVVNVEVVHAAIGVARGDGAVAERGRRVVITSGNHETAARESEGLGAQIHHGVHGTVVQIQRVDGCVRGENRGRRANADVVRGGSIRQSGGSVTGKASGIEQSNTDAGHVAGPFAVCDGPGADEVVGQGRSAANKHARIAANLTVLRDVAVRICERHDTSGAHRAGQRRNGEFGGVDARSTIRDEDVVPALRDADSADAFHRVGRKAAIVLQDTAAHRERHGAEAAGDIGALTVIQEQGRVVQVDARRAGDAAVVAQLNSAAVDQSAARVGLRRVDGGGGYRAGAVVEDIAADGAGPVTRIRVSHQCATCG